MQSDVLIIGGGLAGIVCALQLLDRGRRVLLLDRGSEDRFGGLVMRPDSIRPCGGLLAGRLVRSHWRAS